MCVCGILHAGISSVNVLGIITISHGSSSSCFLLPLCFVIVTQRADCECMIKLDTSGKRIYYSLNYDCTEAFVEKLQQLLSRKK